MKSPAKERLGAEKRMLQLSRNRYKLRAKMMHQLQPPDPQTLEVWKSFLKSTKSWANESNMAKRKCSYLGKGSANFAIDGSIKVIWFRWIQYSRKTKTKQK